MLFYQLFLKLNLIKYLCMFLYFLTFVFAFILSFLFTLILKKIALSFGAFKKKKEVQDIHKKRIPRLGGLAIYLSFLFLILFFFFTKKALFLDENLLSKHIFGLLLGGGLVLLIGMIDDFRSLSGRIKFFFLIISSLIIILSGIGIDHLTNPFNGIINLNLYEIPFLIKGITYHFVLPADLLIILWICFLASILNFLDGLDGLASGISGIGALILFFLSISPKVSQPETALLCLILAGSCFGFLIFNFYPAKIFLGDSGSLFLGFGLAVLAVISGGKLATAFLVLGLPILDGAWTILRRAFQKKSLFQADRAHLHHRLLEIGFSQRQIVLFLYFISAFFGILALNLESLGKFYSLFFLLGIMILLMSFSFLFRKSFKKPKMP